LYHRAALFFWDFLMDMQIPDRRPDHEAPAITPLFAQCLLARLAATSPADTENDAADSDANRHAITELFASLNPRDPAEAQLAVLAIAAAQASMDSFARAARPGVTDEAAIRLRSSALAAARTYASTLRMLRKQPKPVEQDAPKPAAVRQVLKAAAEPPPAVSAEVPPGFLALQPGAKPIPAIEVFQPRDRFGEPIPRDRTDLMTGRRFGPCSPVHATPRWRPRRSPKRQRR
jgi:hypothetical protein